MSSFLLTLAAMPSLRNNPDFRPAEPRLGTLNLAEIGDDPPRPTRNPAPHQGQAQRQGQGQGYQPDQDRRGDSLRNTTRSGFGLRRLLDLLGMTLALLLIWIVYRSFSTLPSLPSQSPWSLLGSARKNDPPPMLTSTAPGTGKPLPPIGQFDFGQTTPITSLPVLAAGEPVELYRSIYELEDSFEARYQPPPGCANLETDTSLDMTDCINHRLNARRAFLASNGRTLTPDKANQGLKEGPINHLWEADPHDRWR